MSLKRIFRFGLGLVTCTFALSSFASTCSQTSCGHVTFVNEQNGRSLGIQVYDPEKNKMIATSQMTGAEEGVFVVQTLYFPLNNDKNKKLLFMACTGKINAVTGCEDHISNPCVYPYYKKAIITVVQQPADVPIVECVR